MAPRGALQGNQGTLTYYWYHDATPHRLKDVYNPMESLPLTKASTSCFDDDGRLTWVCDGSANPSVCDPGNSDFTGCTELRQPTFDPGEPGSTPRACTGSGTKFNRAIPPADQTKTPGACAHAYKMRTGAEGRPNEWPATATVKWSIAWTSTVGQVGVLPAVVRAVPIPRSVQEVQTVVVGGSTP